MKKYLLTALVIVFTTAMFAQEEETEKISCYKKYVKKFEERGAKTVEDGWHEDVIITLRKGTQTECFVGKVKVDGGKVISIHMRFSDGSYEKNNFRTNWKHNKTAEINQGISKTMLTTDDELINVIFVKHIKPPKKKYTTAPDPDDL